MIGETGMVENFDVSLCLSFIRKKAKQFLPDEAQTERNVEIFYHSCLTNHVIAMFSCVVDVEYIPGVSNVVADAISRGHLQVLYQLHPSADRERTQPVAIPTLPGEVAYLQPCSTTACMR